MQKLKQKLKNHFKYILIYYTRYKASDGVNSLYINFNKING